MSGVLRPTRHRLEYEPARFKGWAPDFRLVLGDAVDYAEVKPVTEFPMDVAQQLLNAGRGGWRPMELTEGNGAHR